MNRKFSGSLGDEPYYSESCSAESALDSLIARFKRKFSRFDLVLFALTFILGVIVHMYMFTHKFINHDDIGGLYDACGFGLSSGRWLLHFVTVAVGGFSSSWMNGLAGIFCLSVAAVFVARIFGIRRYVPAVLIAGVMVAFPTVASTYTYMFCSYQYLLALMLSAMGAYFVYKGNIPRVLIGSALITLSMGLYQSYFSLAVTLLVAAIGVDICFGSYHGDYKKLILRAIRCIAALAAAMLMYFFVLRICLWFTKTELTSYHGIDTMGRITLRELGWAILSAYYHFFKFYFLSDIFRVSFTVFSLAAAIFSAVAAVIAVLRNRVYRSASIMLLLIADILILPLAAELIYVMVGSNGGVHIVMEYALAVPLMLPAVFADRTVISRCQNIGERRHAFGSTFTLVLVSALITFSGLCGYECYVTTNHAYFAMDITYESVYAYYVKLTAKIELQEGYTEESRVALIGRAQIDAPVRDTNLIGALTASDAANIYTRSEFLRYFLATDYNWADADFCETVQKTESFKQMPCYPAEGSICTIDGVIVVKLS